MYIVHFSTLTNPGWVSFEKLWVHERISLDLVTITLILSPNTN